MRVPKHYFDGFSKLNRKQRLQKLIAMGALTPEDRVYLNHSVDPALVNLSEKWVENVIGCFPLPLGVAAHFKIDGRDYVIPMVVEETSIIAAASSTAKWVRESGELNTQTLGIQAIGQMQISKVSNFSVFKKKIEQHKQELIHTANQKILSELVKRGGGALDIVVRQIPRLDGHTMAVLHVLLNTVDAMGANIINQVCEFLREPVEDLTGERVALCILSNLSDTKLTQAELVIRDIDQSLGENICEAALFAELDPYRAATHNKGVLNGIDPVVIATGNDWRAVEAGVHAYAARSGQYRSITTWKMRGNDLVGNLIAPIAVGTVGGMTRLHPAAQLCLRILGVEKADALARIIAAVGLVQNLGALKALTTEGISKGHMRLHISNLLLAAGATTEESLVLRPLLEKMLEKNKRITASEVAAVLAELRA